MSLFLGKGDTQSATKLITTIAMVLNEEEDHSDETETDNIDYISDGESIDEDGDDAGSVEDIADEHDHSTVYKTEVKSRL